jgi:hypothetical protein
MKGRSPLLLISAICVWAWAAEALACSCGELPRVPQAYEEADVVFLGRVISVEIATEFSTRSELLVVQSWKGVSQAKIVMEAMSGCCLCEVVFTEDAYYIVYANLDSNRQASNPTYYANSCGRTKILDTPHMELEYLNAWKKTIENRIAE